MPDGERGDDDHERPQAPERDHQAAKEEQVVDALDDVPEARHHEAQRGLIPAWIEPHEPGYAKPELLIGFAAAVACTIALRFMLQATYLTFCRPSL